MPLDLAVPMPQTRPRTRWPRSVVAKKGWVRGGVLVLNIAPRWRAAWWCWGDYPRKVASDSTLRISEFPGLPPVPAETGKLFRHALLGEEVAVAKINALMTDRQVSEHV